MSIINKINEGNVDEVDLLEFITSNDFEIALAAAESPLSSSPILAIAALDSDKRIRIAALKNKNMDDETVILLCNDPDTEVSSIAKKELRRRNL